MAADSGWAMDETGRARRPPINCNLLRSWRDPPEGDVLIHFPYREPPPPNNYLLVAPQRKFAQRYLLCDFLMRLLFVTLPPFGTLFFLRAKNNDSFNENIRTAKSFCELPRRMSESERLSGRAVAAIKVPRKRNYLRNLLHQWPRQQWRRLT